MTGNGEISIEVVLSRREDQLRKFTFKAKVKDERDVTIVGNSLKAMVRIILDKPLRCHIIAVIREILHSYSTRLEFQLPGPELEHHIQSQLQADGKDTANRPGAHITILQHFS